ncbi:MAG: transcription antitermination factor NusB [Defluviitaleaceae bacterium]|nr:transcription antitermination factor NusB [Defluviitaleaceae bacterium]
MKTDRRTERKHVFCLAFQLAFQDNDPEQMLELYIENHPTIPYQGFIQSSFEGIHKNLKQIDGLINQNLKNWKFERINKVDLTIIRLAVYETAFANTPSKVAINEAVELAKEFSTEEAPSFINGILGRLIAER